MEARRVFLGLEQPAVRSASELLVERYRQDRRVDLSTVIVAVPGARVGRRFRDALVQHCREQTLGLLPPQIVTSSRLPELLYASDRPFAPEPFQQIVWSLALQQLNIKSLRAIIPTEPDRGRRTAVERAAASLDVGILLWRQYRALAAEGLSFADVHEQGQKLPQFPEAKRWQALSAAQDGYLSHLEDSGYDDRQSARLTAVRDRTCRTNADIFLLGTVDLSRTLQQMLMQVQDRVTPLVFASTAWADRFDALGCLDVSVWCQQEIALTDDQWSVANRPADQARVLATRVSELPDGVHYDDVRIGCADERLVPYVRRVLAELHVPCRWGPGRPIEESGPYQLLKCLHDWVFDDRFESLVRLSRHPQVSSWLAEKGVRGDWLGRLDRFHQSALPSTSAELPQRANGFKAIEPAVTALNALRAPLTSGRKTIANAARLISQTLSELYSAMPKQTDEEVERAELLACEAVQAVLHQFISIPESSLRTLMKFSVDQVMRMVLSQLHGESVPPPAQADAIELLGWLELTLDDAPYLFVGGVNEGFVPQAKTSDLFLPNNMREQLDLDDDRRRLARDAYALSAIVHSRKQVHLVTAKCDAEGNPLKPSRLLFMSDPQTIATRWQRLLATASESANETLFDVGDQPFGFRIPAIETLPPLDQIRVTDFKSFLACSYRYYLEKRLKLRVVEDDFEELNYADFGTLIHEVLGRYGNSSFKDSADPAEIDRQLQRLLNDEAKRRLGAEPLAAVQVQLRQISHRLRFFANEQARLIDEGWRMFYSESSEKDETTEFTWNVNGHDVRVVGRIDRIDFHEELNQFRVLDYKTFDVVESKRPEKTHLDRAGDWIDLQLPMYRHLAKSFDVKGTPQLGYFILGKDEKETRVVCANWDQATLESADVKAREVIDRILRDDYDPPVELPTSKQRYDAWRYLCLDDVPQR